MKANSNENQLQSVIAIATATAAIQMHRRGNFKSSFLAFAPSGLLVVPAAHLHDEELNKIFANTIYLYCLAIAATAGVLMLESCNVDFKSGEQPGLGVTPSQAPSRQYGLALHGEALNDIIVKKFFPILRDEAGRFVAFGSAQPLLAAPPEGLTGRLLPRHTPSDEQRRLAKLALSDAGLQLRCIH